MPTAGGDVGPEEGNAAVEIFTQTVNNKSVNNVPMPGPVTMSLSWKPEQVEQAAEVESETMPEVEAKVVEAPTKPAPKKTSRARTKKV